MAGTISEDALVYGQLISRVVGTSADNKLSLSITLSSTISAIAGGQLAESEGLKRCQLALFHQTYVSRSSLVCTGYLAGEVGLAEVVYILLLYSRRQQIAYDR